MGECLHAQRYSSLEIFWKKHYFLICIFNHVRKSSCQSFPSPLLCRQPSKLSVYGCYTNLSLISEYSWGGLLLKPLKGKGNFRSLWKSPDFSLGKHISPEAPPKVHTIFILQNISSCIPELTEIVVQKFLDEKIQ